MRRSLICLAILLCTSVLTIAQTDSIRHRIFLVGDAGSLYSGKHPVVDWLKANVDWNDEKNIALFLGDNVYEMGLPTEGEPNYAYYKQVIDYQMSLVKGKKAKAYFVMGNHDWMNGKIGGWQQAMRQEDYINGQLQSNIQALPTGGCPGPEVVEVDTLVALAMMDSQWFLHTHDKPGPGSSCLSKTIDEFSTELNEIVQSHQNQLLVLVDHHPLHTHGVHGGATYTLRHHIFPLTELSPSLYIPLPVLGSIYPIARGLFGNIQDVNHPLYRGMARTIEEVLAKHRNPIVVSGHDHSLQLLLHDSLYQIVSGSGAKLTTIDEKKHNNDLLFAHTQFGCAVLEVYKSGKVTTKYFDINSPNYNTPLFAKDLNPITKLSEVASSDSIGILPDKVTVSANTMLKGNALSRFLVGRNYRQEWTTPITMPVLNLGEEQGGLRPVRLGGGRQTRSLRLEDKNKKEWTLRSIEKFPEAAIPADLRQTFAKDIVEQGISASYPYASLSVGSLAQAVGVPYIRRKLVYVPSDPRLQRFRSNFSELPAILEEREPVGIKKTDNTDEVVLKLFKDNDDHIDQRSVLRARLLDNFIMDFDRHEDQWRWASYDTGKGKVYFAIPRDHDQAFFKSEGIIPRFAAKPWFVPELQGFKPKARNIKTFNRPARNLDRFFLTELNQQDWEHHIDTFLNAMTDEVIEGALKQQPQEVQDQNMNEIIAKLKKRRQYFRDDMMKYYRFISKEVNVTGSNQREQFHVIRNPDNSVQVIVNKINKDSTVGARMYDRVFDPSITKVLNLYGLGDEDRFIVEGDRTHILVRMIGGQGNDTFIHKGNGGNLLAFDAAFEKNNISGNPGIRNRISSDPGVNTYNRLGYKYNYINPGLTAAYNIDDGVYLGGQLEVIRQRFRKEPYGIRQYVSGSFALKTGAFRFRYEGDWIKAIGNQDLLVRADIRAPVNVTNFFGVGNTTTFDKDRQRRDLYYRTRYNYVDASVLLRRQLQSWFRINYGGSFQYYKVDPEDNQDRFISDFAQNGLNPETIYKERLFAGAHLKLDINSKNNAIIPTRGFVMDVNLRPLAGLNEYSHNLLRADIDMRVYASVYNMPRLVIATRLGWGKNYGKFEFPQAYYLGGTENLRGYRRDRFAGRTRLYNNFEVRYRLADFSTYLFPGSFGVLAFNDIGRVWADGEHSTDWKVGNGVGVWLAPIKRFVIAAHFARSKEEKFMPYVTFGFQF
jgi:hypothetical protein